MGIMRREEEQLTFSLTVILVTHHPPTTEQLGGEGGGGMKIIWVIGNKVSLSKWYERDNGRKDEVDTNVEVL